MKNTLACYQEKLSVYLHQLEDRLVEYSETALETTCIEGATCL